MKKYKYKNGPFSLVHKMKRATSELLILLCLSKKPMYTYQIEKELEEMSDGVIKFTAIYSSVYRLEEFGYVKLIRQEISDMNRVQNYYSITKSGLKYLDSLVKEYQDFTNSFKEIINFE